MEHLSLIFNDNCCFSTANETIYSWDLSLEKAGFSYDEEACFVVTVAEDAAANANGDRAVAITATDSN